MLNLRVKPISWKAFSVALFSFILIFSAPLPFVLASSKSPYDSGCDHGCDDARISDSSEQYINQPEKGPDYHTSEFMDGYYGGLNSCNSGNNDSNNQRSNSNDKFYNEQSPSYQGGKTLEDYCNEFYGLLGLSQPCDNYVNGNEIQGPLGKILFMFRVDNRYTDTNFLLYILSIAYFLLLGHFVQRIIRIFRIFKLSNYYII